ncbi:MAG: hypothetical protein J6V24_11095, partial [Clostridia bacterium]|nr:hypothetical protein [Clostridia bacterium]
QVLEKRGAGPPRMDPSQLEDNRGAASDYTPDMGAFTLDLLARTAYLAVNPDWSEADVEHVVKVLMG